ncbi:unnamed protein product [Ixodes pacificus]
MLTESVLFAVQVRYAHCSVRSSNRFLVILPCPGTCMCIMYDCFLVCRLLLCGDVESNPGPDNDCMLDNILKGQAKILNGIDDLKSQLVASDAVIASLRTKVTELERLLQLMSSSTSKIDGLDSTLSLLQTNTAQQTEKLVDLEDRSRRSNLVIYGLPEPNNETDLQLKDHVVGELFEKKLDVKCCSIGRIHRLGRKKANRPVILYLQDYNEKQAILKNAKKLKGTHIFIENDYSRCTLRKRKLLWESARSDKANGRRIFMVNDKLRIDDDTFIWDDSKNARVKISSTHHQPEST